MVRRILSVTSNCQSMCDFAKRKDIKRGLEYNIHCLQDTIFSSYTFINLWCSVVASCTFALSSLRRICESAKLDGVRDDNFTFGQNSLTRSIFSGYSTLPELCTPFGLYSATCICFFCDIS